MILHNNNVNNNGGGSRVLVMMILFFSSSSSLLLFYYYYYIGPSLTYITSALGSSEQRRRHTHSAQFAEALEGDIEEDSEIQNKKKDSVQDHEPLHAMEPEQSNNSNANSNSGQPRPRQATHF